jgi:mannose-1-phosphate guanylyltransferase
MKALILAAGKGTRLKELTESYPKVMVDVGGKPCLQYNIELLKKYGIKDIAINTHHFPEKIIDYFGDGSKFGVSIRYSKEPEILGTAGALNNFRDFFNEDFVVIYGDVLHKTDLNKLIEFHRKNKGIATLALDNRPQKGKGVVILDGEKIVKFVEKPEQDISGGLINSGVYVLSPKILDYIPKGFSDFGKEIFPKILGLGEKLYGFKIGKVIDIGTLDDLEKARLFSQK